jgi:hypothetical protein
MLYSKAGMGSYLYWTPNEAIWKYPQGCLSKTKAKKSVRSIVVRNVMPCSLAEIYQVLEGPTDTIIRGREQSGQATSKKTEASRANRAKET